MMLLESSNSQNGYFLTFSQVHGLILLLKSMKRSSSNIFSYYIAEKKEKVMERMLKIFANYNKLVLIAVLYKVFVFVNIVPSWKKKLRQEECTIKFHRSGTYGNIVANFAIL